MDSPCDESEVIYIPINECFGGYTLSKDFINELNKRRETAGLPANIDECSFSSRYMEYRGEDPIFLELLYERGSAWASGGFADLYLYPFPKKYLHCCYTKDYDGKEHPEINSDKMYASIVKSFFKRAETDTSLTLSDLKKECEEFDVFYKKYNLYVSNIYYKYIELVSNSPRKEWPTYKA